MKIVYRFRSRVAGTTVMATTNENFSLLQILKFSHVNRTKTNLHFLLLTFPILFNFRFFFQHEIDVKYRKHLRKTFFDLDFYFSFKIISASPKLVHLGFITENKKKAEKEILGLILIHVDKKALLKAKRIQ